MTAARMRCAFLTMEDESNFVTDYALAIPPLEALGWNVEPVPWRDRNRQWGAFDAVYIAAPWDYTDDHVAFLQTLALIQSSAAQLVNDLPLVEWNLDKIYLRDLALDGIATVPTIWSERFDASVVERAFETFEPQDIVIKPRVGANASDIHVLPSSGWATNRRELANLYDSRAHLLQPFIQSVQTRGEFSLFYFGGEFSHAIRKVPAAGDFRVQEEHGASISPVSPMPALAAAGAAAIAGVPGRACYARADFVENDGAWLLMELELVEPSLYLRMEPNAPRRFAAALDAHLRAIG